MSSGDEMAPAPHWPISAVRETVKGGREMEYAE
jgi:hypothetical protein